ncbi:MAG TPA: hypothetical protein VGJ22_11220, partial [Anaerolineales bacterium]
MKRIPSHPPRVIALILPALLLASWVTGAVTPAGAKAAAMAQSSADPAFSQIPSDASRPFGFPAADKTSTFSQLQLYPNIETIGIIVTGAALPKTAQLMYRPAGDPNWHTGHPLMRIDDGRLAGSLFGLSASTSYEIKVLDGAAEISGAISTQPDDLAFTPSIVLHVDDDAAPGGDGSSAAPFRTIQAGVNAAGPGTQVLV